MKTWSLNAKITSILSMLIVSSVAIAGIGLDKMREIEDALQYAEGVVMKRITLAGDIRSGFRNIALEEKNFILEATPQGMREIGRLMAAHDKEMRERIESALAAASEASRPKLLELRERYDAWWKLSQRIQDLSMDGKNDEALRLTRTEGRDLRVAAEKLVDGIYATYEKVLEESARQAEADYAHARNLMLAVSLLSILFGIALSFVVLRAVSRSITRVIADLKDNSTQVSSAAHQIAASSEELSQAATQQAASLEETASSIEEMSSMVEKNSENARSSSEVSSRSQASAERGRKVVEDMITAIGEIDRSNAEIMQQINRSNERISEIVKVIAEIGNKTKVINDIVFQTKLLSFNASVEAARAGEHGKGFAVVAEEVGNLAQMSGNASKEIAEMLEGSIRKVEGIVAETKSRVEGLVADGKSKVERGTQIAQQCGQVLDEIVANVSSVNSMVREISTASEEQSRGIKEISKAMSQLDQVTQTNAATSEEAASAAEELSAQSESLKSAVLTLIQAIKGGSSVPDGATASIAPAARAAAVAEARPKGNVVPLREQRPKPMLAKAVGHAGAEVPVEDDPRFQDL